MEHRTLDLFYDRGTAVYYKLDFSETHMKKRRGSQDYRSNVEDKILEKRIISYLGKL